MDHRRVIVMLQSILLTVCCCYSRQPVPHASAVSPPAAPSASPYYQTFPAPAESVWITVLATLADRGYPLPESRSESRTVLSGWLEEQSRQLSEGKGLFARGERRGEEGPLNEIADLPETKGSLSRTTSTPGKEGEPGSSTTTIFGKEVGVWTKCRHRMRVTVAPTGAGECGVEARSEIECWETQERKTWAVCPGRSRLESEFFTALEERLAR
jgi:hypothetical protein